MDKLELLEKTGIIRILVELSTSEGTSPPCMSELKERTGVPNGTIQKRMRELTKEGLIDKSLEEGENGRVRKCYRLSEQGKELSKSRIAQLEEWMEAEEEK